MNEEYLLKTIEAVISAHGFGHISYTKDAVFDDLKMALIFSING